MEETPLSSGDELLLVVPPARWLRLLARVTRRIAAGERVWFVLTRRGWWVLVVPAGIFTVAEWGWWVL